MSLSSSAWFTGDDGPADPPSERPVPPVAAPVSAPRTLPVTPAERTAADMLRAWQAWPGTEMPIGEYTPYELFLLDVGDWLQELGLAEVETSALTPAGAALLARVEAAERTPLPPVPMWFADEGHYEGTYRKGAGFAEACGMSIARKALGLLVDRPDNTLMPLSEALAARLSGTTPIDAPANAYKIGPISAGRVVTAVSTPTRIHTAAGSVVELLPGESVEIEPCPPAKEPR